MTGRRVLTRKPDADFAVRFIAANSTGEYYAVDTSLVKARSLPGERWWCGNALCNNHARANDCEHTRCLAEHYVPRSEDHEPLLDSLGYAPTPLPE